MSEHYVSIDKDVWERVTELLREKEKFTLEELPYSEENKADVRETLHALAEDGWLESTESDPTEWSCGRKGQLLLIE